jgi:rare lipoprotein A
MSRRVSTTTALSAAMILITVAPARTPPAPPFAPPPPTVEVGLASYYGAAFDSLPTASGERFDMDRMTAAHRTLPFGTHVRVNNLRNGRSTVVRINDRGPFVKGRVVDVSEAAARKLRMLGPGIDPVRLEVLPPGRRTSQGSSGDNG